MDRPLSYHILPRRFRRIGLDVGGFTTNANISSSGFAIGVAFPNRKRLENQTALAYFKTILQSRLQPYVTYTRNDRLELYEWK